MIYIRADMNEQIATGHIMRCLSIADVAKQLGENTTFILADIQAEKLVRDRGHQCIILNSEWNRMENELEQMIGLIHEKGIKVLLVDSYFVTEHYLEELNKHTYVMYLDDRNSFHYPVSSILCYAAYYDKFHYEINYPNTQLLLGMQYAPLRQEFCGCGKKAVSTEVRNLLLMSGGTDQYGIIEKFLDQIDKQKYEQICVICGTYYKRYEELTERYRGYETVKIVKAVSNIKDYMEKSDVVISAAGSTLYELAAVGTPAISYTLADNQIDNAVWWNDKGIISYAGDVRTDHVIERMVNLLDEKYESCEYRNKCSVQMQQYVDGKGAGRIVREIIKNSRLKIEDINMK